MLANCVNPDCSALLHSFSEGRLFQFDVVSISVSASDNTSAPFDEKPHTQTTQFWLCARCAVTLKLVLDPMTGLRLVPQQTEAPDVKNLPVTNEQFRKAGSC